MICRRTKMTKVDYTDHTPGKSVAGGRVITRCAKCLRLGGRISWENKAGRVVVSILHIGQLSEIGSIAHLDSCTYFEPEKNP